MMVFSHAATTPTTFLVPSTRKEAKQSRRSACLLLLFQPLLWLLVLLPAMASAARSIRRLRPPSSSAVQNATTGLPLHHDHRYGAAFRRGMDRPTTMLPEEEGAGGCSPRRQQRQGDVVAAVEQQQDDAFSATMADEGGLRELVDGILVERMSTRYYSSMSRSFSSSSHHQLYTACEVTDPITSSPRRACAFMAAYQERLTTSPSNFSSLVDQRGPIALSSSRPHDATSQFPILPDLRPLPDMVSRVRTLDEIPTYYCLYRGIISLYRYAYFHAEGEVLHNPLGGEWGSARVYHLQEEEDSDPRFHHVPFALSMTKGKCMVLLLRGTMSGTEWAYDFNYKYADASASVSYFPGRVHAGFFTVFQELLPDVLQEVLKQRPAHLVVAGHSLGGSVGALLAFYLRMASGVPTDVVGYGSLLTGDEDFIDHLRRRVNARFLVFLGRGWEEESRDRVQLQRQQQQQQREEGEGGKGGPQSFPPPTSGKLFTVGDALVQFTCGPFPACPEIGTGPAGESYQYALFPAIVAFYAEDLPNPDSWRAAEDVFATGAHQVIASHVCSYMCWLGSSVGDPDDRCLFADDEDPTVPFSRRCVITSNN